jgi:gas vesicle protein
MNSESNDRFFAGIVLGAVLGAAVALLYAPQSGPETRRLVKDKALEIKEKAAQAASKIKESTSSFIKREE